MKKTNYNFMVLIILFIGATLFLINRGNPVIQANDEAEIILSVYSPSSAESPQLLTHNGDGEQLIQSLPISALHLQTAISPINKQIYVSGYRETTPGKIEGFLAILDSETYQLIHEEPVPYLLRYNFYVGAGPVVVPTLDGQHLYVQTSITTGGGLSDHRIRIFDTEALAFTSEEIQVSSGSNLSQQCNGVILFPDNRESRSSLYTLCSRLDSIRFIDFGKETLIEELFLSGMARTSDYSLSSAHVAGGALAHQSRKLYILTNTAKVIVIDLNTHAVINEVQLEVGSGKHTALHNKVALSQDESTLYIGVADTTDDSMRTQRMNEIWSVDTNSWKASNALTMSEGFHTMTYEPANQTFYLSNFELGVVRVFRMRTAEEVASFHLDMGQNPVEVMVKPSWVNYAGETTALPANINADQLEAAKLGWGTYVWVGLTLFVCTSITLWIYRKRSRHSLSDQSDS